MLIFLLIPFFIFSLYIPAFWHILKFFFFSIINDQLKNEILEKVCSVLLITFVQHFFASLKKLSSKLDNIAIINFSLFLGFYFIYFNTE